MSNRKFITFTLIIAIVLISLLYITINNIKEKRGSFKNPFSSTSSIESPGKTMVIFFATSKKGVLVGEDRDIETNTSIINQIEDCIRELIQGPHDQTLFPVIPRQTELSQVFIDHDHGLAYVDFSSKIHTYYPGGAETELLTIYAIINTICYNFPEIKRVQILVEGQEIESLAGHVYIKMPLAPDWNLIENRRG
jgi:spore germination protein GerM